MPGVVDMIVDLLRPPIRAICRSEGLRAAVADFPHDRAGRSAALRPQRKTSILRGGGTPSAAKFSRGALPRMVEVLHLS